ncbi:MAG TPA: NAD(P)/FAD-dependent oxidoreductase [Longimicrobiales bacterium]|nr:NAD(P)/FAD-dependent oxidoreductase [Longimicrobiales bacterium]
MSKPREFEIAVVGGGPAGLSCGIWLGRYGRSTGLIDSGDPRNWETTGINGFLGLPRVRPALLRQRGRSECRRYGVRLIDGCVDRVRRAGSERFELVLENGRSYAAQRLVIAIGLRDTWPDLPGLEHCYGLSAHHCPDCDGYEARGKHTIIVGHGPRAAALALALTTWTDQLILCTNGQPCALSPEIQDKLRHLNIPVIESRVKRVASESRHLRWLEFEDGMQIDAEKLFFTVQHRPADDLGAQLGCDRDEDGLILVDDTHRTSVEHVFAVGDITPGAQLAITAAADGAVAAAAIHRSLLPEARRLS